MINYAALNDVVDFYEIFTFAVNACEPKFYNGLTPIKEKKHGANYQYGMVKYFKYTYNLTIWLINNINVSKL